MTRILFTRGYKYVLAQPYRHVLATAVEHPIQHPFFAIQDDVLTINYGYAWDGPSGPAIDTKNFMRGSLVHDVLYQAMDCKLLPVTCQDMADRELQRICRQDGMSRLRAWWVYKAVHWFGGERLKRGGRKVEAAP